MRRIATALATSMLGLSMMAAPALAGHGGSVYTGTLLPLNGVDGSGTVQITLNSDATAMTVDLDASGLADFPHAMHVHGIVEDGEATSSACPPASADTNNDGVIDVAEGAPHYGGVRVSLTTEGDTSPDSALAVERYPSGSTIDYDRAGIPLDEENSAGIAKFHVVVHGVDENGDGELNMDQQERSSLSEDFPREATLPALCGTLTVSAATVQTGAGGAASTADTGAFALGGGLLLAGLGMGLRRRGQAA